MILRIALLAVVLACPVVVSADLRITEIMYDAEGSDSKREWIEVQNTGDVVVNLGNFKFVDKANHALNLPPKNGGIGSMVLTPGSYAILASDATTFVQEYPGISVVIDTTMSLNNTTATFGLKGGTEVIDSATYVKTQGAAGDGDSLQLSSGVWIHAKPTPGKANATSPSVPAAAKVSKEPTTVSSKSATAPKVASAAADTDSEESNDPLSVVNTVPTDAPAQVAAAGVLGGSYWWLAAAALAIGTGAIVTLISRTKRSEWDIVDESE